MGGGGVLLMVGGGTSAHIGKLRCHLLDMQTLKSPPNPRISWAWCRPPMSVNFYLCSGSRSAVWSMFAPKKWRFYGWEALE